MGQITGACRLPCAKIQHGDSDPHRQHTGPHDPLQEKPHLSTGRMDGLILAEGRPFPCLCPIFHTRAWEVANGGMAMDAYASMCRCNDPSEVESIRTGGCWEYCKLDTLGMVRILEKLRILIRSQQVGSANLITCLGSFFRAFHKSSFVCMASQLSGDVLVAFPTLTASSGLKAHLPLTSPDNVCSGEPPSPLLLQLWFIPMVLSHPSRSISPGWVGFRLRMFHLLSGSPYKSTRLRHPALRNEGNPPVSIHPTPTMSLLSLPANLCSLYPGKFIS